MQFIIEWEKEAVESHGRLRFEGRSKAYIRVENAKGNYSVVFPEKL